MTTNKNDSFNDILENHYNEIFHYVNKQVVNIEDAKDLTQDIFLKVYEKYSSFNPEKSSIRTWLYRIAHNVVINNFKNAYNKYRINIDDEILDSLKDNDNILAKLVEKEKVEDIINLMNKHLNSKHLRVMYLYFFSELSIKEISDHLNIPNKTVNNIITLSIKKIQYKLEVLYHGRF
ncbi:MAG: sigma-70 family RNA polymerase sigma factor [Tenericutes bacterium]|nr:sigma-70 family RNA polymerase sigma factor [Mycoplasmatota bacterium]